MKGRNVVKRCSLTKSMVRGKQVAVYQEIDGRADINLVRVAVSTKGRTAVSLNWNMKPGKEGGYNNHSPPATICQINRLSVIVPCFEIANSDSGMECLLEDNRFDCFSDEGKRRE